MIRHIVMWRLADTPDKAEKAAAIKEGLEALKDKIPEIVDIQVGININEDDTVSDVVPKQTNRFIPKLRREHSVRHRRRTASLDMPDDRGADGINSAGL